MMFQLATCGKCAESFDLGEAIEKESKPVVHCPRCKLLYTWVCSGMTGWTVWFNEPQRYTLHVCLTRVKQEAITTQRTVSG